MVNELDNIPIFTLISLPFEHRDNLEITCILLLIGRIAVEMRRSATDVARSVVRVSVCVLVTQTCCAKTAERSRCRLGG